MVMFLDHYFLIFVFGFSKKVHSILLMNIQFLKLKETSDERISKNDPLFYVKSSTFNSILFLVTYFVWSF